MSWVTKKLPLILVGIIFAIVSLNGFPAVAQDVAAQVTLYPFYNEDFPQLTAYLDVHELDGGFAHGLQVTDVQILEDSSPVPIDTLNELHPGVQLVLAIAPGPAFDIRDSNGVSRFDYLRQGINAWAYPQELNDDLSLVTPWSSEIAHVSQPSQILAGLESYPVLGVQTFPDLQILSRAVQLASSPTPRPGMERAILFITAPQAAEGVAGLQSLAAQASDLGIRIYVWALAAEEYFTQPDSAPLRAISGQTGGQFFAFTGTETVPNPEEIIEPLRYIYQFSYTSRLTTSGSHQAIAQVNLDGISFDSNAQTFEVTLLPPQPAFKSPPSQIQRAVPIEKSYSSSNTLEVELLPVSQTLSMTIEFPDGYVRPLVRTTLYVDGAIVNENTAEPFDLFVWDLRSYLNSGTRLLRVEAVDSLGLSGLSAEIPVVISVPTPERNILAALLRNKLLITGMGVVIAGAILALVLILGGKIRPPHPAQVRRPNLKRSKTLASQARRSDPVTQPVKIAPIPQPAENIKTSLSTIEPQQKSDQKSTVEAVAYLTPLAEAGESTLTATQLLNAEDAVLGSDPLQATIVLNNASVEAVHAILRWEECAFHLVDNNTVAGTWVNYVQVGMQGVKLEHRDLIYVGSVGFRFNLKEPGQLKKPFVRPYQEPF